MERDICIVGILVNGRSTRAPEVQEVLTKHGSLILSRNGIPDPGRERGIITLTLQAHDSEREHLEKDLGRIDGVTVKSFCLAGSVE